MGSTFRGICSAHSQESVLLTAVKSSVKLKTHTHTYNECFSWNTHTHRAYSTNMIRNTCRHHTHTGKRTHTLTLQSHTWYMFTRLSSHMVTKTRTHTHTHVPGLSSSDWWFSVTCWAPSHTPLILSQTNTESVCQVEMPLRVRRCCLRQPDT